MSLISGFFETIFCLLGLGLLLFLIAGFFAPFESLKWWAGWTDHGLEPAEEPSQLLESLPETNTQADHFVVYLTGIGGSSGLAEGTARIIRDPADVDKALSREEILVVPFTDMSWTPFFSGIGGLIAETGGQLSHSAIVAREYGLPAVVSVKHATRLIEDGQWVKVDGTNGRVYLQDGSGAGPLA